MPSPIASAGIVLAAFLTGLLGPRLLSGGASGSHADRIRVSELQQANTVLQQKLRVASDTLQQLKRSHGATIEDLSQKISAMEGSSSEEGGAGGGGGGGLLRKCRRQLDACRQKELTPGAVERPLLSAAAAKPGGMHAENDTLLAVHRKWDWKSIVQDMMIGWPRIEPERLETRTLALALALTLALTLTLTLTLSLSLTLTLTLSLSLSLTPTPSRTTWRRPWRRATTTAQCTARACRSSTAAST